MDLNAWFHWLFPSPGYFLLGVLGVFVLLGLVLGITDSTALTQAENPPSKDRDTPPDKPWWKQDEQHFGEWNAHQVRERHRTAGKRSALD